VRREQAATSAENPALSMTSHRSPSFSAPTERAEDLSLCAISAASHGLDCPASSPDSLPSTSVESQKLVQNLLNELLISPTSDSRTDTSTGTNCELTAVESDANGDGNNVDHDRRHDRESSISLSISQFWHLRKLQQHAMGDARYHGTAPQSSLTNAPIAVGSRIDARANAATQLPEDA